MGSLLYFAKDPLGKAKEWSRADDDRHICSIDILHKHKYEYETVLTYEAWCDDAILVDDNKLIILYNMWKSCEMSLTWGEFLDKALTKDSQSSSSTSQQPASQ